MASIRAAVARDWTAIHDGTESPDQYAALAGVITEQIRFIVTNCKLEPEADAQLHRVIGQLVAAAQTLRAAGSDAAHADAVTRAAAALDAYGRYFAHPGWKALNP